MNIVIQHMIFFKMLNKNRYLINYWYLVFTLLSVSIYLTLFLDLYTIECEIFFVFSMFFCFKFKKNLIFYHHDSFVFSLPVKTTKLIWLILRLQGSSLNYIFNKKNCVWHHTKVLHTPSQNNKFFYIIPTRHIDNKFSPPTYSASNIKSL